MFTFQQFSELSQGEVMQCHQGDAQLLFLLTDSRQAFIRPESIFFAIKGERHDGHQFIKQLYEQGCRQFVIEDSVPFELPQTNILKVHCSTSALQQLAAAHRQQFHFPVIGITGSNGKTIVKEWLSQLLSFKYKVVKSPKSYNSQIGVPLSVWQLNKAYDIALIEAGISEVGEMPKLEKVIQPTVGIFTNLGPAHDQGFTSYIQKASEKASLFSSADFVIYRKDYPEIDEVLMGKLDEKQHISWSTTETEADYLVVFTTDEKQSIIAIRVPYHQHAFHFHFAFQDEASLENVTHCIIYLLKDGWTEADIQQALEQLKKVKMRLEVKEGIHQCYLLDDSYSNDLAGLKIALDHLQRQNQGLRNSLILSDLLQSAYTDEQLYQEVIHLLQKYSLKTLILIGPSSARFLDDFRRYWPETYHYLSTDEFLNQGNKSLFQQENILIKGARSFGFERIVKSLQKKVTETTLEINLDAIIHNLNYIRSLLKPETKLMVMVKAFSYGGASFEIANVLQYHRVDYLAVAYVDEGMMLRENGIHTPVLVLNPTEEAFPRMIEHGLEPEIYSMRLLNSWILASHTNTDMPPIHLKLDTGMHRLGFMLEDIDSLVVALQENPHIKVSTIFSHLVASEDPKEDKFSYQQFSLFETMYEQISQALGYSPTRHILNSAGILRFPDHQFDMVRLGIGLYGVDARGQDQSPLRVVSSLKTVISQIKELQIGETVGYNRRGKIETPKRVATIAIGYADGFDRRLGNGKIQLWVHGKAAPTIGNVCMDMSMIDISEIDAVEGDEVIVFGEEQSVSNIAEVMQSIPYEVLTNVSARVKRIFFYE